MKFESWFPTTIGYSDIDPDVAMKDVYKIINQSDAPVNGHTSGYVGAGQFKHEFLHRRPEFKKVFDQVWVEVLNYLDYMGVDTKKERFYYSRSWFTQLKKCESGSRHSHREAIFSGVLYLEGVKPAEIQLRNPNEDIVSYVMSSDNPANYSHVNFHTKVGRVILFPSYINHSTLEQAEDEQRISMAFDITSMSVDGGGVGPPPLRLVKELDLYYEELKDNQ